MTDKKQNQKSPRATKNSNQTRMLIDASQSEETRVAVVKGGQLQDFDIESLMRKQIKSNIYLAKVTRVEPSLQAAFVNYGGNRHGFLPFSEIHPDYYRIPVADRERLMAEQEELERQAAEEAARVAAEEDKRAEEETDEESTSADEDSNVEEINDENNIVEVGADSQNADDAESDEDDSEDEKVEAEADTEFDKSDADGEDGGQQQRHGRGRGRGRFRRGRHGNRRPAAARNDDDRVTDDEDVGGVEPLWKRIRRAYKIQEVIKRGQIMLIQVNKEERGNKGAAVTTYITLPGRYCVLMPNTPQSGGVSRKIANFKDRKRMREILKDLSVPDGMSVILRTAGTTRTKVEIKRDLDYLMRLWNNIRDLTLKSTAPALINEEGSLIRRSIRDIYNKDVDEVIVAGEDGYKSARDMMKMLMPSHVKKVVQYKEAVPLFIKEDIETQIEDMHSQTVQLKSGGYLVINPTEALVSIDVNSGRSTKERNIEDTALRTNLEAAEEVARQLRLRDLGGLVVIDFIDMEKRNYNAKVERAMRDALAHDRARIQVGRISSFGLMEMSRQRLQPSLTETHFETCPHCYGMGIVKTVDTVALAILRAVEESAIEKPNADICVTMESAVALYLFNNRRQSLAELEGRYGIAISVQIGAVEDEKRFSLVSTPKPVDEDDAETEAESPGKTKYIETDESGDDKSDDRKPSRSRGRRRRRSRDESDDNVASTETPSTKAGQDNGSDGVADVTESDEQPKAGKRTRKKPAVKKIDIVETVEYRGETEKSAKDAPVPVKAKAKPSPSPTNDNAGDTIEGKEPQVHEKVNEKPEKKKKGWWNKIIES